MGNAIEKSSRVNFLYVTDNHLGSVMVTVSDKKIGMHTGGLTTDAEYYLADVTSAQDYFAYQGLMPGRKFNETAYRYGANAGNEKDDEIYGSGNALTAEYWEYDTRLGKRWNIDPIIKPWESPYAAFGNNPVYYNDPSGLDKDPPVSGPDDDCRPGDTDSKGFHYLEGVEVVADGPSASITVSKHYAEPTWLQDFVGWLNGVERSMRGNAYWTFGVEFKTTDGESNGNTANPVKPKDFDKILTIENWDEVDELLDLLGLSQKAKEEIKDNPFKMTKIKEPKGLADYNKLRGKWKGTGRNSPSEASTRFTILKSNIDKLNNTRVNPTPGNTQIGSFNVNGTAEGESSGLGMISDSDVKEQQQTTISLPVNIDSSSTETVQAENNAHNRALRDSAKVGKMIFKRQVKRYKTK